MNKIEERAIKRLEILAKDWPESLWIWAADGALYVMRKGHSGYMRAPSGGVDPDYIEAKITIDSDGGDW